MLNEQELTNMCKEICSRVNHEFNLPIAINGRLKTTLGRVCCQKRMSDGYTYATRMEFSKSFLMTATSKSITEVVEHECCHYLVAEITHEDHGHDKVFKDMCARIGCKNDTTVYNNITYEAPQQFKYTLVCKDCGAVVGHYHRAGKIIKNIENYSCNHCNGNIKVIQNY